MRDGKIYEVSRKSNTGSRHTPYDFLTSDFQDSDRLPTIVKINNIKLSIKIKNIYVNYN
ncbi:MAG: hypothetical protein F6K24_07005 [Okeania sp. SIO2D1]|nr:hypothetical protein [Okeania sp. SIO2D1]